MNARRFQTGFTLIELLLVLAIVAILAAIAIPSLLGSKDYAKYVGEGRTNARSLAMALESYRSDNGAYPPAGTYTWQAGGGAAAVYPAVNPVPSFKIMVTGQSSLQLDLTINGNLQSFIIQAKDFARSRNYFRMDQNGVESAY